MGNKRRRNPIKVFVCVIGVILALVIVAGLVLTQIELSSPKLRDVVVSKLSAVLGMPVRMETVSVRLLRGITAKNLSLGEGGSEIFSAKGLVFRCNFFEMLRRRFNVRSIVIEEPVFTLRSGEAGFLLPLMIAGYQATDASSGFEFQLAEAKVLDGKVSVERKRAGSDETSLTVDEINLEISSEGKGKPVRIEGSGNVASALGFSVFGFYKASEEAPVNFRINTDLDWARMREMLSRLGLSSVSGLRGTGRSTFDITLTGKPDKLDIDVEGDLTESEISYGELLRKPGGLPAKLKIKSVYSPGKLDISSIRLKVGEGELRGSGVIESGGRYRFSVNGKNVDVNKLLSVKKNDDATFEMTGKAELDAHIASKGIGAKGLNGRGSVRIESGTIKSFSWMEDLLSTIHLPELMPFKYSEIASSFSIVSGKITLHNTTVQGKDAVLNTEEAEIDLVQRTKNILADLALAPHLVERERSKFKEFDRLFYVDERGYAHLSIVWAGPLSETTPDVAASILKTGIKRYGEELLKKLFGEEEDE